MGVTLPREGLHAHAAHSPLRNLVLVTCMPLVGKPYNTDLSRHVCDERQTLHIVKLMAQDLAAKLRTNKHVSLSATQLMTMS